MAWETESVGIEFYRENSDPKAFDVEYTVEYTLRYRYDEDSQDYEAEADGPFQVTYTTVDGVNVPFPWEKLTAETRATFERMIKVHAQEQAREWGGVRAKEDGDDSDARYESWRDR